MVSHRAMPDVPRPVVEYLARLLAGHRRVIGTRRGTRALGSFLQAVLVLRWFRDHRCVHCLARDAGISQATGYRYLHEGIDVLAAEAPGLAGVLEQGRRKGLPFVVLDGTLIRCDRVAGETERGTDLWYAIRIKRFAGNVQFLAAPDGTPLWVSDVEPGSTHDLAAARIHALPDLYQAARDGLPTLADIGYIGAGGGIHVPFRKHPDLPGDIGLGNETYNKLLRGLRFTGERAMAVLKQRWRTLQHVTLSPNRIGAVTQAALVLNNAWQ
ncbi:MULTISPECIES: transposase family protein [unclassified Streptomyces]|uniref:IS5/IS1182 family transposase n=1 Tax=Streptomyces sp. NBC_00060 TaxID=2975636 RepID=A0AAU2GSZ4_9ACTN